MTEENAIRIMLVDDHDMVRHGLTVLLRAVDGMELVAEASDGQEAIEKSAEFEPDVILMDIKMPRVDGVGAIRAIREKQPDVQIVALTSFHDSELVQSALKAGAVGYMLKNASIEELVQAIKSASKGEPALSQEATQALIDVATRSTPSQGYNLTPRELEVLALMAEGLTNAQIAQELTISRSTVKFHVSSILSKMGVASRTEAVAVAIQHNLVE